MSQSVRLGFPRAIDGTPATVPLAELTCFGGIDRMKLANSGSCDRSHPPVLDTVSFARSGPAILGGRCRRLRTRPPRALWG